MYFDLVIFLSVFAVDARKVGMQHSMLYKEQYTSKHQCAGNLNASSLKVCCRCVGRGRINVLSTVTHKKDPINNYRMHRSLVLV